MFSLMCYHWLISAIKEARGVKEKKNRVHVIHRHYPPKQGPRALSPLITISSIKSHPNFNVSVLGFSCLLNTFGVLRFNQGPVN